MSDWQENKSAPTIDNCSELNARVGVCDHGLYPAANRVALRISDVQAKHTDLPRTEHTAELMYKSRISTMSSASMLADGSTGHLSFIFLTA